MAGHGKEEKRWMRVALREAKKAKRRGEVPIGALLVRNGRVWARGHSETFSKNDPTAHAEISVLRRASQKARSPRFTDAICYTTLEPCPMCATALVMARVKRVVFGAKNPRMGACGSVFHLHRNPHLNHAFEVKGGVLKKECEALLNGFFRERR